MACGIEKALCFLKIVIIKLTVGPISFIFFEISKFVLVLALAFWITIGIFLMWESIMPEAARRLSAAAEAVVANTSGLMPQGEGMDNVNKSGSYPFVIDLPKVASSIVEKHVNDETLPETATAESGASSIKRPSNRDQDLPPLQIPTEGTIIGETEERTAPLTPNNSKNANKEVPEQAEEKPAEPTE